MTADTVSGEALKPCPFCGAKDSDVAGELGLCYATGTTPANGADWFVRCYQCHVETARVPTEAEAVAHWNARASSPDQVPDANAIAKIIRNALVENWRDTESCREWNEDILLVGTRRCGGGKGYQKPNEAADNLALDAANAVIAALTTPLQAREGYVPKLPQAVYRLETLKRALADILAPGEQGFLRTVQITIDTALSELASASDKPVQSGDAAEPSENVLDAAEKALAEALGTYTVGDVRCVVGVTRRDIARIVARAALAAHDGELEMSDFDKPVKITISEPDTGKVLEERICQNDYCLITAGNRYVKSLQIMGRTHMIAVAVAKPEPAHDGGGK